MAKEDKLSDEERKEVKKEIAKSAIKKVHSEFKNQVSTAIITAFGLVIALAWKDLVTAIIPSISPPGIIAQYPYLAQLWSAIIITIVAVIGILLISRWAKKGEN